MRVVGIFEVDDVVTDEVHGRFGHAQRLGEPDPQRIATNGVTSHSDVGYKQRDKSVHIA
jgi:hypothetical protein